MIVQKFKQKIFALKRTLKFIYSQYTGAAIGRDILFIISTATEIYGITIFGKFIDETTNIFLNWSDFDLNKYLATDSFYYLLVILILWIVVEICVQFRDYLYNVINEKVWKDSRQKLLSKVSGANLEDIETEEFQNMLIFIPSFSIGRITSAYENFSTILSNIIRLVSAGIILFGTMGWTVLLLLILEERS